MLYFGIDVGTQGVRGVVCDEVGAIAATHATSYQYLNLGAEESHREQSPTDWWNGVCEVIKSCVHQLNQKGFHSNEIRAISIDGTSGTVLLADDSGNPLGNALMYNDGRSVKEAEYLNQTHPELGEKLGYKFNSSYALPKLMWLFEHTDCKGVSKILHQTDYILGKLCGNFSYTDYSNALKTGYDILEKQYPTFMKEFAFGDKLPQVGAPGTLAGNVTEAVAKELGLSTKTAVVLGATDGYASALSAGAVDVSEYATVVGTTLVIKGVSERLIKDPLGRVYCHLHPMGYYMPGGASNVGGRCLNEHFDKSEFAKLDEAVKQNIPTYGRIYPLTMRGERFPFVNPDAVQFAKNLPTGKEKQYGAYLEGVAFAERLCYDTLSSLGAPAGEVIYSAGGGSKSNEWLKIRASVLNKTIKVPKITDAALGCAVIAASNIEFKNIVEAARSMVEIDKVVEPEVKLSKPYDEIYHQFLDDIREHYGYTL